MQQKWWKINFRGLLEKYFIGWNLVLYFLVVLWFVVVWKLPLWVRSMCIYQFASLCEASYIGCTNWALSEQKPEHYTVWPSKRLQKSAKSFILEQLVNSGHSVSLEASFKTIHTVRRAGYRWIQMKNLFISEVISIDFFKPNLCVQEQYIQSLMLTWFWPFFSIFHILLFFLSLFLLFSNDFHNC